MNKFTKKFLTNALKFTEDESKLVMRYQKLFPSLLVDENGFCVEGRKLWKELGKPQGVFSNWTNRKIIDKNYKENEDYLISYNIPKSFDEHNSVDVKNMNKNQLSRYGISVEYNLTIDCAKKIGMRQNDELGDLVCDYFILMENAIKKNINWNEIRYPQKQGYKDMCKLINEQYRNSHDGKQPNKFVYSSNGDMLNLELFGLKSKQMKELLEVEYEELLRDNLCKEANHALYELQLLNGSLILSNIEFHTRKIIINTTCKSKFMDLRIRFVSEFNKEMNELKRMK